MLRIGLRMVSRERPSRRDSSHPHPPSKPSCCSFSLSTPHRAGLAKGGSGGSGGSGSGERGRQCCGLRGIGGGGRVGGRRRRRSGGNSHS